MNNYKNTTELIGETLKIGDTITFTNGKKTYKSTIRVSFLSSMTHGEAFNNKPLTLVGCNTKIQQYKFCEDAYGYKVGGGDWPEYDGGDMEAATRVVLAIFKKIEEGFSWRKKYEKL